MKKSIALSSYLLSACIATLACGETGNTPRQGSESRDSEAPETAADAGSDTGAEGDANTTVEVPAVDDGGMTTATSLGSARSLASGLVFAARFALDETNVYVANRPSTLGDGAPDEVLVVPRDGSEPSPLAGMESIASLASVENRLWVLGLNEQTVNILDKASGNLVDSESIAGFPIAITATDEHVVIATSSPFGLMNIPKQSSSGAPWQPGAGVLDGVAFWMEGNPTQVALTLHQAPPDADTSAPGDSQLLLFDPVASEARVLVERQALLVDVAWVDEWVLFADNTSGTVERVPMAGGTPEVVAELDFAWGLSADETHVYATARPDLSEEPAPGSGRVVRFAHDGSNLQVLAEGLDFPSQIEAASDGVYWVNSGNVYYETAAGVVAENDASLMKIDKP